MAKVITKVERRPAESNRQFRQRCSLVLSLTIPLGGDWVGRFAQRGADKLVNDSRDWGVSDAAPPSDVCLIASFSNEEERLPEISFDPADLKQFEEVKVYATDQGSGRDFFVGLGSRRIMDDYVAKMNAQGRDYWIKSDPQDTIQVLAKELSGVALNWAVARCQFPADRIVIKHVIPAHPYVFVLHEAGNPNQGGVEFDPVTDWAQGGPIMYREGIAIREQQQDLWVAHLSRVAMAFDHKQLGSTPLPAAMRCHVEATLGEMVDVPAEFVQAQEPEVEKIVDRPRA